MIKNDLVNAAAQAAGVPRPKATEAVDTIIDVLRQALLRGGRIELRGFGVLLVKPRKRGIGRDPRRPSEDVPIPPGFTIGFKPGKELRDMTGPAGEPAAKAADSGAPTRHARLILEEGVCGSRNAAQGRTGRGCSVRRPSADA